MADKASLNPKQQTFVNEYLIDLNGTQAAIRAGYSPRSADVHASRLLANDKIRAAVAKAQAARAARTGITADRVLQEYAKLAFSDMRKLMTWGPDGVRLKDSSELTDEEAAAVSEVSQTTTESGGSLKLKVHDKKGALDSVGRHLGMFIDKTDVTSGGAPLTPVLNVTIGSNKPRSSS